MAANDLFMNGSVFRIEKYIGHLDPQMTMALHCITGVNRQIQEGIFDVAGIDKCVPQALLDRRFHGYAFAYCFTKNTLHVAKEDPEVDHLRSQWLPARKCKELRGQFCASRYGIRGDLHTFHGSGVADQLTLE